MNEITVRRAARQYGMEIVAVYPPQTGYRNESHPVQLTDGTMANLILYKREPGVAKMIACLHAVSLFLAAYGFPVRTPLDSRIMAMRSKTATRYLALYSYLPGVTIPWEGYTRRHLRALGACMSDMHAALQGYPVNGLPDTADTYLALLKWLHDYFGGNHVAIALEQKLMLAVHVPQLDRFAPLLKGAAGLSHKQALHMDFVRSNVLFDAREPRISGILDFEKVAVGHPVFDIGRTLAFLLVDC